jgi:hypothetical protein
LNYASFSPKNDQELIEARTKIKTLEISKDNLDLKVSKLEAENKNLDLKNRELCLQIEVFICFIIIFFIKSEICFIYVYMIFYNNY